MAENTLRISVLLTIFGLKYTQNKSITVSITGWKYTQNKSITVSIIGCKYTQNKGITVSITDSILTVSSLEIHKKFDYCCQYNWQYQH